MTKTLMRWMVMAGLSLVEASCTTPVVAKRVESHPAVFQRLNDSEKNLVVQGKVGKGMSKQGVWLAWGEPDSKNVAQVKGRAYEKWTYTGYRPTYGSRTTYDLGDGIRREGFTGPLMTSESAGDQVLAGVRHGYFYGDHLVGWSEIW